MIVCVCVCVCVQEEKGWMRDIFARMALEVERGRATRQLTATTHVSKDDKKVRARKVAFRQGLGVSCVLLMSCVS